MLSRGLDKKSSQKKKVKTSQTMLNSVEKVLLLSNLSYLVVWFTV